MRIGDLQRYGLRLKTCDLGRDVILERSGPRSRRGRLGCRSAPGDLVLKGELTIEQVKRT